MTIHTTIEQVADTTHVVVEVEILTSPSAEYRVVERQRERVFNVVRAARGEPVELLAACPYSYNREAVCARAIRVAELFRDEECASGAM